MGSICVTTRIATVTGCRLAARMPLIPRRAIWGSASPPTTSELEVERLLQRRFDLLAAIQERPIGGLDQFGLTRVLCVQSQSDVALEGTPDTADRASELVEDSSQIFVGRRRRQRPDPGLEADGLRAGRSPSGLEHRRVVRLEDRDDSTVVDRPASARDVVEAPLIRVVFSSAAA